MGEVLDMASQMSQVNDDQTVNLRRAADQIGLMQKGLSELARHLYRMYEDKNKQREGLANLQSYMAEWSAKDEGATRQLQH
jgi:hypothetical protein